MRTVNRPDLKATLSIALSFALAVPLLVTDASAGGFQLSEHTITGAGRAFAGAGVAGDDASDMFYNPAGLTLNDGRKLQIGLSAIDLDGDFENTGSSQNLFTGTSVVTVPSRGTTEGPELSAVIPNLFYTSPDINGFRYGVSITSPFGLKTEYADDWVGRYHALVSDLKVVDINPAFAWTLNDSLSVGAGFNIQAVDAELSQAQFTGPASPDGRAKLTGDNVGYGFTLGAILEPSASTRVGLGFRSKVKQEVAGELAVTGTPADRTLGASTTVDLPETVYLSISQQINDQWGLYGSLRWTNWSRFDELRIQFDGGVAPDQVTDESWNDSSRLSIGVDYKLNRQWTLRAGYAHDETPIPDAERRTPRIPDSDRNLFSIGGSYHASDSLTFDFTFIYLDADDGEMNNTIGLVPGQPVAAFSDTVRGNYVDTSLSAFGAQMQWTF